MDLSLERVRVLVNPEAVGRLVYSNGALTAVLVRLDASYGEQAGHWFLEAGFGRADGPTHPVFPTLAAAQAWIGERLARGERRG